MRNLVGMRVRPEEDALTRLLPYHGLGSKDASEDFGRWMTRSSLRVGKRTTGQEGTESGREAPPEGQSAGAKLCGSCASSGSETDTSGGQTREPALRNWNKRGARSRPS